jgi:hypothetical protein
MAVPPNGRAPVLTGAADRVGVGLDDSGKHVRAPVLTGVAVAISALATVATAHRGRQRVAFDPTAIIGRRRPR